MLSAPNVCLVHTRNKRSKEIVIEKITSCRFSFPGRAWDEVSDTAKVCHSVWSPVHVQLFCKACVVSNQSTLSLTHAAGLHPLSTGGLP